MDLNLGVEKPLNVQNSVDCFIGAKKVNLRAGLMIKLWLVKFQKKAELYQGHLHDVLCQKSVVSGWMQLKSWL